MVASVPVMALSVVVIMLLMLTALLLLACFRKRPGEAGPLAPMVLWPKRAAVVKKEEAPEPQRQSTVPTRATIVALEACGCSGGFAASAGA